MDNLLVTCPDTGRREELGCLVGSHGEVLVVIRCTRFDPPEAPSCATTCVHCQSCATVDQLDLWRVPTESTQE